jgi:BirA family biotin operon repressor/biotin-[acetyl-CoA-carboxylase] ligase
LASTFDRERFVAELATRRLGRTLVARAEVGSTNDEAWEAFAAGAPDGHVVVADAQLRGRGRAGRPWHTSPGRGLALSVLLRPEGDRRELGLLPLAAGLAVAQALEGLGAAPALKWPNDVLLGGRKTAGVLCENRRAAGPPGRAEAPVGGPLEGAVVGVGVNVTQALADFPAELAATATSLALAGVRVRRESVAAAFLNALEPLWADVQAGARAAVLEAWSARADFWGRPVVVRTPGGEVRGVARALDRDGGLVLGLGAGAETVIRAGDVTVAEGGASR